MKNIILNKSNLVNDGTNSRYKYSFNTTLQVNKGDTLSLVQAQIPYSWINISASQYNNNKFKYTTYNGTDYVITLDDGFYTTEDLNFALQYNMINNGHYLINDAGLYVYYLEIETNKTLYKIQVNCYPVPAILPSGWSNPAGWNLTTQAGRTMSISFLDNLSPNFRYLIGFNSGTYGAGSLTKLSFVSAFTPIPHPVSSFIINCNLVNMASVNLNTSSSLYGKTPDTEFGNNIIVSPNFAVSVDASEGYYNDLYVFLTDQLGNPLYLKDNDVLFQLVLKQKNEF